MEYFDRLFIGRLADNGTDMAFSRKSDGRVVFYPWGKMRSGYIATPAKESQIRAFLRLYIRIPMYLLFLGTFLGVIFTGVLLKGTTVLLGFPILLVSVILVYAAVMPRMLADMPRDTEKRTFAEKITSAELISEISAMIKTTRKTKLLLFGVQMGIWTLAIVLHSLAQNLWLR